MCRLDAIILASGLSRRMGCNKLLLPLGNSTVIDQFLRRFPYAHFQKVIVVYGDQQVAAIAGKYPTTLCCNQDAKAGKSHSIQLGLSASTAEDGMMFAVADQPLLTSGTIQKLVEVFCTKKFEKIIVPEADGCPANPVIFPAFCRSEFAELHGDLGGRQLIMKQVERVCYVSLGSEEEFCDVDTPENYQKIVDKWQLQDGKLVR
jgi:molybdenum cofactor cytidylyltransferase